MMTSPTKAHFKPLTSLRFFAAMHVLAFHNHLDVLTDSPGVVRNIIRAGYVSVSLFFVLSGFILAHTYLGERQNTSFNRRSFWIARLARVYPVYLIGLLLAAPFVLEGHFTSDRPGWSTLKIMVMGGSCCTLTQSWIPPLAVAWNGPGWSLSAEAFFYLLFPFVSPLIWRLNKRQTVLALVGLWILSMIPPLFCWFAPISGFSDCPATAAPMPSWVSKLVTFNPLLRLPEFLLGIALGRLFVLERQRENPNFEIRNSKSEIRTLRRPTEQNFQGRGFLHYFLTVNSVPLSFTRLLPWVALMAILGLLACGDQIPYPFLHNGMLDILFAMLIYGLARDGLSNHALKAVRFLSLPFLVLLGEASYAIYILHVPLRTWMYRLLDKLHPDIHPSLPLFIAYTILTLGVSILVFKLVEEPTRRLIRRKLTPAGA
jgi:peptidoglycan/LPS O-acetylase OafA/YrhL